VEIFGPESSGKTTVALHAIAAVQAAGGRAALIDAEHAFDPNYAAAIGIDLASLLVSQPDCGEAALEMVDALIRSGAMDIVVVDSVAALTPRAELEGEIGAATIGLQARLMSSAMRKVAANASRAGTTVLMINQLRMKVGVLYGNPEITPGGNALKFYASARVDVRRKAAIEVPGGANVGIRVRAKVVKNKCAPPYRGAEFDILFDRGISGLGCILEAAEAAGAVERRGAWFYFGETRLGQGKEKSVAALEADDDLRARVEAAARAALGQVAAVPTPPGEADVPNAPKADAVADDESTEAA
jgi:recombination protein RecA